MVTRVLYIFAWVALGWVMFHLQVSRPVEATFFAFGVLFGLGLGFWWAMIERDVVNDVE